MMETQALLVCEAVPIHAPAVNGLVRGRPTRILRLGDVHEPNSGKKLGTVTDAMCAAIVAAAAQSGHAIPIDHGHELYNRQKAGMAHDDVPTFGRFAELEHRPGEGLWGTPEWNEAGVSKLAANPGTLFFSVTVTGTRFDSETGEAVGLALHSVSLTPTPVLGHMEPLALSQSAHTGAGAPTQKEPAMGLIEGAGAQNQPDVLALAAQLDTEKQGRATAEAEVLRLSQELDALKPKAEEAVTLAARIEKLEAEAKAKDFAALAAEVKRTGRNVSERTLKLAASLPLDDARALLMELPVTLPPGPAAHGGTVEAPKDASDPTVIRLAVKLSNDKGIPYADALKLAQHGAQGVA